MAANGGMTVELAQNYISAHWQDEWGEFVSASVHSLIGRLFAIKAIEDGFCVDTEPPLIPRRDWLFHTGRFDNIETDRLPKTFFHSMADLAEVENAAVKDLAATGRFYDWLAPQIDAAAFRRLLTIFFSHNFARLDEDLLGRFFEIYAQRVDRRRRKQLGQYYTPLPIVRHMWRLSMQIVRDRGVTNELIALDPGVGSGTFLIEGANQLHNIGLPRFWERLTGFDISPQAIGIAQINLYLAVLAHLDRQEAEAVGMLQLYPTDALDPRNGARLRTIMPLLADESTRAFLRHRIDLSETVKQRSRFPLVIGNPPYRNNSDQTLAQIADRFPMLLRSSRVNARARKRNIRDDYAWFFAAADYYVADRGLIAFVVSDSFCYATSYRFFREDLLRRYQIQHLIILGSSVFRDVGPRTQFVIVILERRTEDLSRADDVEPIPVTDLRPLADDPTVLGISTDQRLAALDTGGLPAPQDYLPTRERNFTLFPASEIVAQVEAFPNILHGDSPRRVFIKKWPGLITAFDELFRGDTCQEMTQKAQQFLAASVLEGSAREAALDDLARSIRARSAKNRGRPRNKCPSAYRETAH
jgi:methylase of polypeptide subunit release factors